MNPFTFLSPYRWLLYGGLIAALVLGAWRLDAHVQQQGYDRAVAEYTAQALKATEAARVREQSLQSQVTKANDDHQKRETSLLADAGRAATVTASLRSDLANIRASLPGLTRAAVNQRADALAELFGQCGAAFTDMAKKADGHANDSLTLQEAWPK
jgi:hypothetical protein